MKTQSRFTKGSIVQSENGNIYMVSVVKGDKFNVNSKFSPDDGIPDYFSEQKDYTLLSVGDAKKALRQEIDKKVKGISIFEDVITGEQINIEDGSRRNITVTNGSVSQLRIAGGVIWDIREGWSKTVIGEQESPKPVEQEAKPTQEKPMEAEKFADKVGHLEFDKKVSIEGHILHLVTEFLSSKDALGEVEKTTEGLLNKWGIDKNVKEIQVKVNDKKPVKVGKVHFMYELLLKTVSARVPIALVGAAGSGKTTTVSKVAEALGLKFYSKSVSAQTGVHEFFGYQDANGNYVRTLFREAYENGGVFLLDEFDAGNPNVLAALNQATANGSCAFADGMIPKHEDFVCVMAGNTYGHGATSEYVGRNKIDAATLDRFAFIEFPYDEDLEYALAGDKSWCKKVQQIRKKVSEKRIKTIISPRATIIGSQLLASGVSEKDVMELVIFKGLNKEERDLLK